MSALNPYAGRRAVRVAAATSAATNAAADGGSSGIGTVNRSMTGVYVRGASRSFDIADKVERAPLHFIVDASEVLAEDSQAHQLHAA